MCQMIIPCLQELEAKDGNILSTGLLCAIALACFNMDFDVTFLAPC